MTKEFNLSEKMIPQDWDEITMYMLHQSDVKEFIKRLKEKAKEHDDLDGYNPDCNQSWGDEIDKLAGAELSQVKGGKDDE